MADGKNKKGGTFEGLPMESLIGAPLKRAYDAQLKLAESMTGFIRKTGMADSGVPGSEMASCPLGKKQEHESGIISGEGSLKVPLISMVPIPSQAVSVFDVNFDMKPKVSGGQSPRPTRNDAEDNEKNRVKK